MSLDDVRAALRSNARVVLVEAPAGCGKTHEAASLGAEVSRDLPAGRSVLLLAHTNAAVREFKTRASQLGARVVASTIDAFALEIAAPYAKALGLSHPLRPGATEGSTPFGEIVEKACELLRRSPSIAGLIAHRHPMLVLDEHQDASTSQHLLLAELLKTKRTIARIFADPMQAIYGFGGSLVDWDDVIAQADTHTALDSPQRWIDQPELGDWLLQARGALKAGYVLPADAPESVRFHWVNDLPDAHPRLFNAPFQLTLPMREVLSGLSGSVGILATHNAHCLGLRAITGREIPIYEGSDTSAAYELLDQALAVVGDPQKLATLAVAALAASSVGFTKDLRDQIAESIQEENIDPGKKKRILTLVDLLRPIYVSPDLPTWCSVLGTLETSTPEGISISVPEAFRLLGRLRVTQGEDPRDALGRLVRARRGAISLPTRLITTIHKSKGHEFDHVVIAHCSSSPFPNTEEGRRLLYVGMSRARRSITVFASADAPSPLLASN